jgi:hypothetical protein
MVQNGLHLPIHDGILRSSLSPGLVHPESGV